MNIISKEKVAAAVARAMLRDATGSMENAIHAAASALCLPADTVREALAAPEGWCCEQGENLGVPVCDECAETSAAYSADMRHEEVTS